MIDKYVKVNKMEWKKLNGILIQIKVYKKKH